jgi:hypothetical protein
MIKIFRRRISLVLASIFLTCACGARSNNSYPVVVFSDVHFNPFYDQTLFRSLDAADASEWNGIFQTSSISEPSTYGADSNYPLLVLALSSIQQNLGTSPAIIFTGDVLGHNFAQTYFNLSGGEDVAAMQTFASKTLTFFTQFVKSYIGDIPVMFVLGNADSYTGLAPDSTYFANTADIYYSNWIGATADHQTFLNTYEEGGYYSAEPIAGVVVVALNTVALSTLALENNDSQVQAELAWLNSTLASAKISGKNVWLLMHVPPGAYIAQTASQLDPSGHLSAATMQLKPDYQTSLLQTLSTYSDIITLMLGGHTHMDEFRNISGGSPLSSVGFLEITPGITPYFDNNPAYRIFTLSGGAFEPTDYRSLYYNLATLPSQFDAYYTFSTAYFDNVMSGLLADALTELYPELNTNTTKQGLFRTYYYSGSDASRTITDANWKVYWCGIAQMTEQDLIDCVNSL